MDNEFIERIKQSVPTVVIDQILSELDLFPSLFVKESKIKIFTGFPIIRTVLVGSINKRRFRRTITGSDKILSKLLVQRGLEDAPSWLINEFSEKEKQLKILVEDSIQKILRDDSSKEEINQKFLLSKRNRRNRERQKFLNLSVDMLNSGWSWNELRKIIDSALCQNLMD